MGSAQCLSLVPHPQDGPKERLGALPSLEALTAEAGWRKLQQHPQVKVAALCAAVQLAQQGQSRAAQLDGRQRQPRIQSCGALGHQVPGGTRGSAAGNAADDGHKLDSGAALPMGRN